MTLTAAILNSVGGLCLLVGAWIQARKLYEEHKRPAGSLDALTGGNPEWAEGLSGHLEPLDFWPSFHQLSFAGEYGWTLILAGGALVFVGSIIAAIAAA